MPGSTTAVDAQTCAAEIWTTVHDSHRLALHGAFYTWPAAQISSGCVLDLGCEYGFGSLLVGELNPSLRITSMDLDVAGLRYARTISGKGTTAQIQGDAHHLPFASECFTGIYLIHVLHLVDRPMLVLDEVRRALKPGGLAIVAVPCSKSGDCAAQTDQQVSLIKAGLGEFFSNVFCPNEISGWLPSLPPQVFRLDARASAWLALCRK